MLSDNWFVGEKKCSNSRALGSLHCRMDAGELIIIIILWRGWQIKYISGGRCEWLEKWNGMSRGLKNRQRRRLREILRSWGVDEESCYCGTVALNVGLPIGQSNITMPNSVRKCEGKIEWRLCAPTVRRRSVGDNWTYWANGCLVPVAGPSGDISRWY